MNEWLRKVLDQLKGLWGKWTITQKITLLAVVGAALVGLILIVAFSASPSYEPLLGRAIIDPEQQARILSSLDSEGVAYTMRNDMIYVADKKTARYARMILQNEDLITAEFDPWDFFNVDRWSVTEFERDVQLRKALTKQMEMHIESLRGIDDAKVVLDLPEKELFKENQDPYSASVIISPSPGSTVTTNRKTIEGIERLILYGVSGLVHENLVISDNQGNILNDFEGMEELDTIALRDRELKQKADLEKTYEQRILSSLERIWPGRVAIIKFEIHLDTSTKTTTTQEYYPIELAPDNPSTPYDDSVRIASTPISEEHFEENYKGSGITPQGPPGAEGQTPPEYQDLSNLSGSYDRAQSTINYAINLREEEIQNAPYEIKRITASVALDGMWRRKYDEKGKVELRPDGGIEREYEAVSEEDLAKAERLIKDAVGFDRDRRDSVTVVHLQFDHTTEHELENARFRRQLQVRRTVISVLIGVGALFVAAFLYRILSKEMERRRRLREEELARQHQAMREAALRSAEDQGVEVELSVEERARMEMQENAINMAREHPEDVAQLIRTWLVEE